jgi:poly(A) polymerase
MDHTSLAHAAPLILSRDKHCISRSNINDNALKVLYRLHQAGYAAYLVGGGVRDLLLAKHPKDFDVATDASPEQVSELFRNCRLIGRRFRLAHVHFGRDIVEVATFRGQHLEDHDSDQALMHDGMILRDNVFGTLAEDAWRRDFSINALYYNIADFTVVDYTGGIEDLNKRLLRMIGDPHVRCQEDPVRMLRAIRFAAKLEFELDQSLVTAIDEQKHRLAAVPPARLFEEILKLFLSGHALRTFHAMMKYRVFEILFPAVAQQTNTNNQFVTLIEQACINTDQRIAANKPVTPAFLFAVLLWGPVAERANEFESNGMSRIQSLQEAGRALLHQQSATIAIPKRFRLPIREIWTGQARLMNRRGRRAFTLFEQARFRAIYDFLLLRTQSGESDVAELSSWWTEFQAVSDKERKTMVQELQGQRQGHKPRHKKNPSV